MPKKELEIYDVKTKERFKTTDYDVREKKGRFFAVAKSKAGKHECWRILSKAQAEELK